MNNFPKISVITPVKNGAATLEKTIQSLIDQNYPNLEYIVIDGASVDGTLEVIEKYKDFINYFESEDDKNNVIAHIKGIKKATGELVAFLNADDFYEKDFLNNAAKEFKKDNSLDIISFRCRTLSIDDSGNIKIISESKLEDMELSKEKFFTIPAPNARFFKKDLFFKYGFQLTVDDKNRAFVSNDVEYLTRFILNGAKSKAFDFIGYNYLVHENSLTFSSDLKTKKRLCEDKIFIAKRFLNSKEFDLPKAYEKTFRKWIKKYRAKLIALNLKEKNWVELKDNFRAGIKENGVFDFGFYVAKALFRDS